MASPAVSQQQAQLFPPRWRQQLIDLSRQYRENEPFPHVHLANFLETDLARAVAQEFPNHSSDAWLQYKHYNENKMGMPRRELFPGLIGRLTDELNSPEFLSWLSELTGIRALLPDPTLEGGGMHQSGRGGFLNIHADFTMHHHKKDWRRRLNLILYLNEGWQPEWGGAIELWERSMTRCVAKVDPILNHALIFNTDEKSYHGFPDKLRCPENVTRKSLALYYYTIETNSHSVAKSTNYQARPDDGVGKTALIWADKQAVNIYSKVKSKLGLSDNFASKVLGFLSQKK